jgi:hypothetical protein
MSFDCETPYALYRTHLELYFRLDNLLRASSLYWIHAGKRSIDAAVIGSRDETDRILGTRDWPSLGTVSADLLWNSLRSPAEHLGTWSNALLDGQFGIASGITEAFLDWGHSLGVIVKESAGALPALSCCIGLQDDGRPAFRRATGVPTAPVAVPAVPESSRRASAGEWRPDPDAVTDLTD